MVTAQCKVHNLQPSSFSHLVLPEPLSHPLLANPNPQMSDKGIISLTVEYKKYWLLGLEQELGAYIQSYPLRSLIARDHQDLLDCNLRKSCILELIEPSFYLFLLVLMLSKCWLLLLTGLNGVQLCMDLHKIIYRKLCFISAILQYPTPPP